MKDPFKIAIDLHGTYDSNPTLFNQIMFDNRHRDVEFIIFSGSPVDDIREQFTTLFTANADSAHHDILPTINYLSVVDECRKFGYPMIQKKVKSRSTGEMRLNWYLDGPDELWWPMKAVLCTLNNIAMLIDDKPEYENYFGRNHATQFVLYNKLRFNDTDTCRTIINRVIDYRMTIG